MRFHFASDDKLRIIYVFLLCKYTYCYGYLPKGNYSITKSVYKMNVIQKDTQKEDALTDILGKEECRQLSLQCHLLFSNF